MGMRYLCYSVPKGAARGLRDTITIGIPNVHGLTMDSRRRWIRNSHVYNGPHPGCGCHGVIQEIYGAKIYTTVTVCQVLQKHCSSSHCLNH